jgi:hypothetical protein
MWFLCDNWCKFGTPVLHYYIFNLRLLKVNEPNMVSKRFLAFVMQIPIDNMSDDLLQEHTLISPVKQTYIYIIFIHNKTLK